MRKLNIDFKILNLQYCGRGKNSSHVPSCLIFADYNIEEFLSKSPLTDYIEFKSKLEGKPLSLSMYKNSFNAFKNLSSGNVYPTTGDLNPSINQPKTKFRVRTELIPLLVRMGV